jgi:serine/threonine protein kinase
MFGRPAMKNECSALCEWARWLHRSSEPSTGRLAEKPAVDTLRLVTDEISGALREALGPDYRIDRPLQGGGMSRVFLTTDLRHDRKVVVKILVPELETATTAARFKREIELTIRLQHPHILPIITSGECAEGPYYITPFIPGESLRDRMSREGQLPLAAVGTILRDVAGALAYAHAAGVSHRDVKPGNILLNDGRAILADFGIARPMNDSATPLTGSGIRPGTPGYMAPGLPSDESGDIYALGVVGYEMLVGKLPSGGVTEKAIVSERGRINGDSRQQLAILARAIANAAAFDERVRTPSAAAVVAQLDQRFSWRSKPAILLGAAIGATSTLTILAALALRAPAIDSSDSPYTIQTLTPDDSVSRAVARELSDRFLEWRGVRVSEPRTDDRPRTLRAALQSSRAVHSRHLVVIAGTVVGDSVDVRASLYDAERELLLKVERAGFPLRESAKRTEELRRLANSMLRDGDELPWTSGSHDPAPDIDAWRIYDGAIGMLRHWDLAGADSMLRRSIALDPQMVHAHLALAQTAIWLGPTASSDSRLDAARALNLAPHGLNAADSLRAASLLALADGNFPGACTGFNALIGIDSTDFAAWLDLAECLRVDRTVVRSSASPTGWAFRTSFEASARAYQHATQYVDPNAQSAFRGWLLGRLSSVLFPTANTFRHGFRIGADSLPMGAFPYLDHDTLSFAPHSIADFALRRGDPEPSRVQAAVSRNREVLRGSAEDWVRAEPKNPAAYDSLAAWTEISGGRATVGGRVISTGELLARAREMSASPIDRAALAVSEVRVLIKSAEFARAAIAADSLLRSGTQFNRDVAGLPGIAALLGHIRESARLVATARTDTRVPLPNGRSWTPPKEVSDVSSALEVYGAFGVPADSARVLAQRTYDLVTHLVPDTSSAAQLVDALVARPLSYGDGSVAAQLPLNPSDPVERAVFLAWRGDRVNARKLLSTLDSIDRGKEPGYGLTSTFRRATVALQIGDSAAAVRYLDEITHTLPVLDPRFFSDVANPIVLVRAFALRAQLGQHFGDPTARNQMAEAVLAFWKTSDAELAPTLESMRNVRRKAP